MPRKEKRQEKGGNKKGDGVREKRGTEGSRGESEKEGEKGRGKERGGETTFFYILLWQF